MRASSVGRRPSRWLLLILWPASTACVQVLRINVPGPTGPHAVGRTAVVLRDTSRADPYAPGTASQREIPLVMWYPADATQASPRAPYLPNANQLPGAFRFGERWVAGQLDSHARLDAPVARSSSPWPLLILSPGADTPPHYYSGYATELASRGYVVIAIDHAHEGRGQVLPDGRVLTPEAERSVPTDFANLGERYERRVRVRIADIQYVLDALPSRREGPLGHVDLSRIGTLGHSLGGVAAAELCRQDHRVLACANLDGLFLSQAVLPNGSGSYHRPILYAGKPFRDGPTMSGAVQRDRMRETISRIGGGYDVVVPDASHDDFTDGTFMKPGLGGGRHARLAGLRTILTGFFDATLRGASAVVLEGDSTRTRTRLTIIQIPAAAIRR